MARTSFNQDWTVKPKVSSFSDVVGGSAESPVTLPHDAMINLPRSPIGSDGPATGYFPGGSVEYRKTFDVPADWRSKRVSVQFEGVYRDATVFVNNAFAGQRRNGYVPFTVRLDPYLNYGERNTIRVEARAHQDSRWYSGLGIYRDTALVVTDLAHLTTDGVQVTTPDVDDERAVVEVATPVLNEDVISRRLLLATTVCDADGEIVAADRTPVTVRPNTTAMVRHRLYVPRARRWSVDRPYLYAVESNLIDADAVVDEASVRLGIRTLRVDPQHGLRINDETLKLRGACIHHDNGLLGAATFPRAEERRIEILKSAGFNAVRSAHHPMSPAMLDACDRLGMLVLDEVADVWQESKKPFDYSLDFTEWWERDVQAMVDKDFNHPSVIMYSIGNEIPEVGSGFGASLGREVAEKVRSLDETRFTTNAISGFIAVQPEIMDEFRQELSSLEARGVNDVMNAMTDIFDRITTSDLVTERTAESQAAVDVAGLNYAEARYASDGAFYPNRVILGTETNPRNTDRIWPLVEQLPHVIGDFTWTGWDYLGEVGLGRTDYTNDPTVRGGGDPDYPWLLAWCGDIDITGHRRPASYFREIVYGLRAEPYLAVYRPEYYGMRRLEMQWAWSDTVSSWSWDVPAGAPMEVEVYSDAEEVELLLNGTPAGRGGAGPANRFRARFEVEYQPGTLTAVAYSRGAEHARTSLHTADGVILVAEADRRLLEADKGDLAFVAIELRDANGNLASAPDRQVSVEVSGPGTLQALGSARPANGERFDSHHYTTFDGRALAVIRAIGAGAITVRVTSDGLDPATVQIEAQAPLVGLPKTLTARSSTGKPS